MARPKKENAGKKDAKQAKDAKNALDGKMIACCGLDCAACPALLATKNNDNALREKTARMWSEMFKADIKPEYIVCEGCMGTGKKFSHCNDCHMRKCATGKNLSNCAACSDYPCEQLKGFQAQVPEAKATLDGLRKH